MNNIISTQHGATRMRQRGMRNGDVALILDCGTQLDDETWLLRERDTEHAIKARKREIQKLERLKNRKIAMCDRQVRDRLSFAARRSETRAAAGQAAGTGEMTAASDRGGSRADAPDGIASALELLLEEVERGIDCVNRAGSSAFQSRDHSQVQASLVRSEVLTGFRDKVDALGEEWRALAVSVDLGERGKAGSPRRDLGKLLKGLKTPEEAYIEPILQVLNEMRGRGRAGEVVGRVGHVMEPVLRDVDYQLLPGDGKPRWQKTVHWARFRMIEDGLLRSDSPHGIWEISDEGRAHLGS